MHDGIIYHDNSGLLSHICICSADYWKKIQYNCGLYGWISTKLDRTRYLINNIRYGCKWVFFLYNCSFNPTKLVYWYFILSMNPRCSNFLPRNCHMSILIDKYAVQLWINIIYSYLFLTCKLISCLFSQHNPCKLVSFMYK